MEVALEPHIGRWGKLKVHNPQYKIFVDGFHVGYLPYASGSSPLLFVKLGPIEKTELEEKIKGLVGPDHAVGGVQIPPDPPKEFDDDDDVDPFDALGEG